MITAQVFDSLIADNMSFAQLRAEARTHVARFHESDALDKSAVLLAAMAVFDERQHAYMQEVDAWYGVDPVLRPSRDEWMGRMRPVAIARDDAHFELYRLVREAR